MIFGRICDDKNIFKFQNTKCDKSFNLSYCILILLVRDLPNINVNKISQKFLSNSKWKKYALFFLFIFIDFKRGSMIKLKLV